MKYYKLNPDHSIEETDMMGWGRSFETQADRIVAQDKTRTYFISTVFLGIDHNVADLDGDKPILFETMVFYQKDGRNREGDCLRCATWDEAVQCHLAMCAKYKVKSTSLLT